MRWVWRTLRRAVREARTAEEDPPTRGEDTALLGLLRTQPYSTADELAEAAGAPAARVARQLQALEARGHVTEHDGRYRPVG
jgi:predicted Rossmann fold nucleotide-binding protein DprA/Smf involved in DNA uptake